MVVARVSCSVHHGSRPNFYRPIKKREEKKSKKKLQTKEWSPLFMLSGHSGKLRRMKKGREYMFCIVSYLAL
jgi:hypothetical protein